MEEANVKLYTRAGEHEAHLENQLKLFYSLESFTDTRFVCCDGELCVNSLIAALSFPELYTSPVFNTLLAAERTVLLPEHTMEETQRITWQALNINREAKCLKMEMQQDLQMIDEHDEPIDKASVFPTPEEDGSDIAWTVGEDETEKTAEGSKEDDFEDGTETLSEGNKEDDWIKQFVTRRGRSWYCTLCTKSIRKMKSISSGMETHLLQQHREVFQNICFQCKISNKDPPDFLRSDPPDFLRSDPPEYIPSDPPEYSRSDPPEDIRPEPLEEDCTKKQERLDCNSCGSVFHRSCVNQQSDKINSDWCQICRFTSRRTVRPVTTKTTGADGEKTSLCPECGKKFRHLSQHIRFFHLGVMKHTPAQCHICNKVYSQKSHLKEHIRAVHELIKKHKCTFCGREFYRKVHFHRHMKRLHMNIRENYGPVACPDCGKTFNTKNALYKHNRVVHLGIKNSKTYFCEDCGQTFTQSGSLYSHMRRVHCKEPDIPKNRSNIHKDKVFVETNLILEVHPELKAGLIKQSY